MSNFMNSLCKVVRQITQQSLTGSRQFHALTNTPPTSTTSTTPWSLDSVRTIIRNNFPKAREQKRIKAHGWKTRLSTRNGRRILMQRILKGRWYYSH